MDAAQKRLLKEARECAKLLVESSSEVNRAAPNQVDGGGEGGGTVMKISPFNDNLYEWDATLLGPPGTPYHLGIFQVKFFIPADFPMKPPVAKFVTKIFHPNIHFNTGEVCLDLLKSEWSPSWTLYFISVALIMLLANPEPSSPLNCDAGNLLRCGDQRGFDSLARMYTRQFAAPSRLKDQ